MDWRSFMIGVVVGLFTELIVIGFFWPWPRKAVDEYQVQREVAGDKARVWQADLDVVQQTHKEKIAAAQSEIAYLQAELEAQAEVKDARLQTIPTAQANHAKRLWL